jgi:transcriptional regulator with XRE-family HTH domain
MSTNNALKSLRKKRGFSQEYVAEMLNISQSNYSRLESGHTRIIADQIPRLASIFGVDVSEFFPTVKEQADA